MIRKLECFRDERGSLSPLDFKNLPFDPKRCFFVFNAPKGTRRGDHAHYITEQYLICLSGEVDVGIIDGDGEKVYTLNPTDAILIPKLCWDYQIFKTGKDLLVVLASTEYDKLYRKQTTF
jgi:dTDP-4-dehydrorhamnose 3,5-epimerase-like enzyme